LLVNDEVEINDVSKLTSKVVCTLFDEIKILVPGDGPSNFPSLGKTLNFNAL